MKRFDFDQVLRDMDAELVIQDGLNAEQAQWAETDAMNNLGEVAMTDVETDLV